LAVKTKTAFGFPTWFNVTQPRLLVWGPALGLGLIQNRNNTSCGSGTFYILMGDLVGVVGT